MSPVCVSVCLDCNFWTLGMLVHLHPILVNSKVRVIVHDHVITVGFGCSWSWLKCDTEVGKTSYSTVWKLQTVTTHCVSVVYLTPLLVLVVCWVRRVKVVVATSIEGFLVSLPPQERLRSIVMRTCVCMCVCVCVYVCPWGYLWNHTCDLYQIFVHVAYGRGSVILGVVVMRYVLPFLWITSCFLL